MLATRWSQPTSRPSRGTALVLEALGLEPLLDLGLRLGEGSGAALALPIVQAALAVLDEMATFESAGVSDRGARALAAAVAFLTASRSVAESCSARRTSRAAAPFFPVVGAGIGALRGVVAAGLEGPLPAFVAAGIGARRGRGADRARSTSTRSRTRRTRSARDRAPGARGDARLADRGVRGRRGRAGGAGRGGAVGGLAERRRRGRGVGRLPARSRGRLLAAARPRAALRAGGRAVRGACSRAASPRSGPRRRRRLAVAAAVGLLGWDGAIAAGVAAAVAIVGGVCVRLWIGGVTGDTLGAATQFGEIAVLVTVVGLR